MSDWEREIGAITLFVPDLDRGTEFFRGGLRLASERHGRRHGRAPAQRIVRGACGRSPSPIRPAHIWEIAQGLPEDGN
jgi:catechol 2,3-dioxygenase-like lactoylglutathione lyase family enzyme